jgi:lactate 2-monooxygenase
MAASIGRETQSGIFRNGALGRAPLVPAGWSALEAAASRVMSEDAWAYVAGSSGLEKTTAANSSAFGRWELVPRMLRDASVRDLTIKLFRDRGTRFR